MIHLVHQFNRKRCFGLIKTTNKKSSSIMEKSNASQGGGGSNKRGGKRKRNPRYNKRPRKKGKKQQGGISFTHFFAIPLWDEVQPRFRDRQEKFKKFVKEKYPEYDGTYKFQPIPSAHISVSMIDLRTGNPKFVIL